MKVIVVALAFLLPGVAGATNAGAQVSNSTQVDDAGVVADFVLPTGSLSILLNDICVKGYETHLHGDAYQQKLEMEFPGMQAAMLEAMGTHCTAEIGPALSRQRVLIREALIKSFSKKELSRLATAFAPQAEFGRQARFPMQKGDTGTEAFNRSWNPTPEDKRRFEAAATPLLNSPDGPELIERIAIYQKTVLADFENGPNGIKTIIPVAKRKAVAAANAFARSKGSGDVYRWPN